MALVATFSAVVSIGMAVEHALARRRRPVELLEAQVGGVSLSMREQQLERSFLERAVLPLVSGLGSVVRRVTPVEMLKRTERKLVLAGSPPGWDAEKVVAFKIVAGVAGGVMAFAVTRTVGLSGQLVTGATALFGLIGYAVPGAMLGQKAVQRQDAIRKALADTMDLLTISVEAGLGFDAALAEVIQNVPGPLSREIARMLQEMQLGVSRVDGLRHLADRTDVEELRGFVLAMIQADIFGVSIAAVLRAQAKELRTKRRQRAERKAMTTPLKLLFPMIFCILPALFVVVLGPGIIRIIQDFFGINP
jgi:tight adherence protein C